MKRFFQTFSAGINNAKPHPTDGFGVILAVVVLLIALASAVVAADHFFPWSLLVIPGVVAVLGVYNWVRVYRAGAAHLRRQR